MKAVSAAKLLLIAIAIGYVWELIVAGGPGSLFQGPSGQALIDAGALVPYSGGRSRSRPAASSAANTGGC